MSLTGLILAAGSGKRMQSDIPKVLHPIAGVPMLEWVIQALKEVPCDQVCAVLSPNSSPFKKLIDRYPNLAVCIQKEANGTAGAVAAAQSFFKDVLEVPYSKGTLLKGDKKKSKYVLICAGDAPAVQVPILQEFIRKCRSNSAKLGILGMNIPNPKGYGRLVLSDKGKLLSIVEEKDADEQTKKIRICNSGIIFAEVDFLFELLGKIDNKNAQGEYYLTECVRLAVNFGEQAEVFITDEWHSFVGVNDREQLASLDEWFRENKVSFRK